jgi:hypothetical protein
MYLTLNHSGHPSCAMGMPLYSQAYQRFGREKNTYTYSLRQKRKRSPSRCTARSFAPSLASHADAQTVICPFPSSVPRPRPGAAGTMQMQPGAVAAPRLPPTRAPPVRPAPPQFPRAAQSAQKVRPLASPPNPQWPNFVA